MTKDGFLKLLRDGLETDLAWRETLERLLRENKKRFGWSPVHVWRRFFVRRCLWRVNASIREGRQLIVDVEKTSQKFGREI